MASIGQLAAGIAHEINNPLGYINSNLETLGQYINNLKVIIEAYRSAQSRDEIALKEKHLKIGFILDDVESVLYDNRNGIAKIANIVKNLKDFARVDSHGEWETADINLVIENVLTIIFNEVKYVASVETQLGKAIPPIFCHKSEISQVLLNILLNSIYAVRKKFGDEKGKIQIRTAGSGQQIICEISDNGCGIPEKIMTRIFEPFFTTKAPGEGTGLGLHIAYDIVVNRHKGEIDIKSREGEGTSITLKIPYNSSEKNGKING